MQLTIATITAREHPRYDWLIEALAAQQEPGDELELVIVDLLDRSADELVPNRDRAMPALRQIAISPPKPNPWQGGHRVTSRDLHAIANARNTALCMASHGYIAFLDDRVHLGPRWLETVRRGELARSSAIAGPCDRDELGIGRTFDDRRGLCPHGMLGCSGRWLYGGNFALPLAWALEVGGCEEATDPVGRQDRVLGHMLENRGRQIDYLPAMSVLLDRRLRDKHPVPRITKGVPPADKGRAIMDRFACQTETTHQSSLVDLRGTIQQGGAWPDHGRTAAELDWFDGSPIGDM